MSSNALRFIFCLIFNFINFGSTCFSRDSCPKGFQSYKSSCYKIVNGPTLSREAANTACESEGAHLVDITLEAEQNTLVAYLKSIKAGQIWIGLSAQVAGGELVWSDGSSLDFTAWGPDGRRNEQDCVRLYPEHGYKWRDRSCAHLSGYICEIDLGRDVQEPDMMFTPLQDPSLLRHMLPRLPVNTKELKKHQNTLSSIDCAHMCNRNNLCTVFVYNQNDGLCTLYDNILYSFDDKESVETHYVMLC